MWRRGFLTGFYLLSLAAGVSGRLFAADTSLTVPQDTRDKWVIGVSELDTSGVPTEYTYLAASIPQLLLGNLQALSDHTLRPEERDARAKEVLQTAVMAAGKELSTLIGRRDQLLFSSSDGVTLPKQYSDLDSQIEAARRRLAYLQGLEPSAVPVAEVKPIEYWSGHQEGKLLPSPAGRPAALAAADSLESVIFGTISVQAGLAYLDIYGYNRVLDTVDYHKSYAGRPEELYNWVTFATEELAGYLLGRSWANLQVQTAPASAAIEVDGTLVGYGKAELKYIKPGTHEISVAEAGYPRKEQTVELAPSKTESVTVPLGAPTGGKSSIDSTPAAADVYVGSLWVGRTPLTVPLPIEPEEVRISKKGYLDSHFLLSPDGPLAVNRTLMNAAIDWSTEIKTRRDRYYTHLGWFLLSVPVPVILNGLYQNELVAASSTSFSSLSPAAQHQVIVSGNAFYYAAWGTAFLSAGLFVNAIISLIDYIQAGQSYHVR